MYCVRHESADNEVSHTDFDLLAAAEEFAHDILEEGGGTVEIFTRIRQLWAENDGSIYTSMDLYNGVRRGIDYPFTL